MKNETIGTTTTAIMMDNDKLGLMLSASGD